MDGGAWWAAVHGVTEGQTQLSDFTFTFHFHALEKKMATCWGPALVDPGNSKGRWCQRGETSLFRDIKRD